MELRVLPAAAILIALGSCASLPEPKFRAYTFPEEHVFLEAPAGRKYVSLGQVRTRVDFSAMLQDRTEEELCQNYYNKAARDLLMKARRKLGADAVIQVRSVVFYLDQKSELHRQPECSEDDGEGQVLLQGEAIRYEDEKKSSTSLKSPDGIIRRQRI